MEIKKSWMDLGVKALGAAYSGTVLGYLKKVVPQLGLSDEVLTTIVGFVLEEGFLIKDNLVENFGEGMLLAGLSQLISGAIGGGGTIHQVKPRKELDPRDYILQNTGGAY